MGNAVSIDLTPLGTRTLRKPIRGRGGFQSLLRKLRHQLDGRHLEVSRADLERLRRYAIGYGGGFQGRAKGLVP
ncbi:MAG: hypothetical protein ABJA98_23675 [Acidobacteriota bacterium]